MKNNWLLLALSAFILLTGKLNAQQIVNHHCDFSSGQQNMWGPSFSPVTLDQTITLFEQPWNVSFNTGSSGIVSIAGQSFGGALAGNFSGVIGSEIRIEGFTTGHVEVDYPVDITLDMPTDLTYDQGDNVTIQTDYAVSSGWDLQTNYPSAGEFFWDLYFQMAADASATLCAFGCTTFPIIPAFNTGMININLVTISGSGASTDGETGIWYLGPGDIPPYVGGGNTNPAYPGTEVPAAGWPYAVPPATSMSTGQWIPWQVHLGAFPMELPDVGFGLSGEVTIPYVPTTAYLNGTDISACGDSTYFNLNLEIFQFLGNILEYVPGPVGVVGTILSNLSGSQSLGIAEIEWNFFSASFDANITNKQCFDFNPNIYGRFEFPVAVDYQVLTAGVPGPMSTSSIVNIEIGQDIRFKFPCYFEELNITPTYTIDGVFTNHTWDSISFDFLMSALEFAFTIPPVTVVPGFTIPEVCVNIPYPCPTWSNPFKICWSYVCTPEIVVPPIGFSGWSLSVGPVWSTSIPIGSIEYDWFNETWSLEGFDECPHPSFKMIANKLGITNTFTDVSCNGGSNGTISVVTSAVTPANPYTYLWTNGSTTEDLTGLQAGAYELSAYDANGCQMFTGATISEPLALTLSASAIDKSCGGGVNNGSVNLLVSGGSSPYTYSWSNGATTEDISSLGAGTYTVTVTDSRLCTANLSATIVEPNVLGQTAAITDVSCNAGSDGIIGVNTFGGVLPYAYSWNSGQTTEDLNNIPAGNYSLTITDGNGCVNVGNYPVAQPATPVSISAIKTDVSCHDGSDGAVNVTISGGTPGYTFIWTSDTQGVLPYITEDISAIPAGLYTVIATDSKGCQAQTSQNVLEPAAALSSTPTLVDILCFGGATGSVNPGISGGTMPYTYNWSNGATTATISSVVAGTYTLVLTDSRGCTDTYTYTLVQPNAPLSYVFVPKDVSCFGGSDGQILTTVSGGTSPYSYSWSNGQTTASINNLTFGNYTLTVTDANACTIIGNQMINQPAAPLALSTVITNVDCYGNNTGAIDATITGGTAPYSQLWSNSATIILSDTTQDLSSQFADSYTLLVTDSKGCQETIVSTVTQPNAPLMITGIKDDANCFGLNDGSINATVSGGTTPYSYSWSNGATTEDISALIAGTYTLTVTDFNGCTELLTMQILQPNAALTVLTSVTNVKCNGDSDGAVESIVSGGTTPYSYSWSNGATSPDIDLVVAGVYTVTVTDAQGCIAFTGATVTEPTLLVVTPVITDASCYGYSDGSVVLGISGGTQPYYFSWGDQNEILLNNPSETLSNLPAADYLMRVRDANGCMIEQIVTVGQPTPFVSSYSFVDVLCYGGSDGSIDLSLAGGTSPYSVVWSNGQLVEDPSNLSAGYYNFVATDAQGCVVRDSVFVGEPTQIDITYQITEVSCIDQSDASIFVTPYGGTMPYTYLWNTGSVEQNLLGVAPSIYQVTITDNHGCVQTFDFEIMINPDECLDIPNTFTPNGDNYNDTWFLENIELYPNATVKIFNKWGNELFSSQGTYTPWDGTDNGNPLPSDVYYYIIILGNPENNQYTGTVTIIR